MEICNGCGGVIGRDCFNAQECEWIYKQMCGESHAEAVEIDTDAIAWAYRKLLAYGVANTSMDNTLMLDRLNLMLMQNDHFEATP